MTMNSQSNCSVMVPSAGENSNDADGTATRRALVLARAKATIERIDALQREPKPEEEFDLQGYLSQFPMPLNGANQ